MASNPQPLLYENSLTKLSAFFNAYNESTLMVDVGASLDSILDSLQPPEPFRVEVIGPMPTLKAREILLSQVFTNLISNAIRY